MAKVSIVMPTYNRAWIVGRAIESVLGQVFSDFELIIVNDGSKDNTANVVESFSDNRIKVINLLQKGGLAHARNTGLKSAKGSYVAYLDSDNIWYPNFLQTMLEAFDKNKNFVMAYSGQNLLLIGGAKNNPRVIARKTRNEIYNPDKLLKGNYIDVNCVVHKTSLLSEIGYYDETLEVLEDWDLFVRIVLRHPFQIVHIDHVLSEYYFYMPETEKTLSNSVWQEHIEDYFGIRKRTGDGLKVEKKIKTGLLEK